MGLTRIRAEQISDIDYKQAVRVITLSNITLAGGAPATVDGVSLVADDRVLVAGQSTGSQNGLYYVQTVGAGNNGTWVRTTDGNETGEIQAGMIVMVTEGDEYKDTQWKLTTNNPIVIGTTALVFEQNSAYAFGNIYANGTAVLANAVGGTVTLTAGDNIAITGNNTSKTVTIGVTGISLNSISNGTSNVNVVSSGGNVTVGIGGTGNIAVFSTSGLDVTGRVSATGNVSTSGTVNATGNISGGNLVSNSAITGTTITTTGTGTFGNVSTSGTVNATGNISGGNLTSNGTITGTSLTVTTVNTTDISATGAINATGNISGGNLVSNATVTATNITTTGTGIFGNVSTAGTVNATGNISGGNLISNSTVIATTITATGTATVGNLSTAGTVNATGNVSGGNLVSNGAVTATTVTASGNVTGSYILGNGSQLTGINAFGNIAVSGETTVSADNTSDTLTLAEGSGIAITTDAANNTITISSVGSESIFATGGDMGLVTEAVTVSEDLGSVTAAVTESYDLGSFYIEGFVSNDNFIVNSINGNILTANAVITTTGNITAGNLISSGQAIIAYAPATAIGSGIQVSAANTQGGTGYADFLKATNSSGGATNPNKTFRLTSTGGLEVVDSAYSSVILSLTNSGGLSVTGPISVAGKQAVNGPAFSAYPSSGTAQTITSGSLQKVLFGTEDFDTNSNFASSTFTPTVEGYYQLNSAIRMDGGGPGTGECMIVVYKNGAAFRRSWNQSGTAFANDFWTMNISCLVYANGTGDYFEIYAQQTSGANRTVQNAGTGTISWFNGSMMRGA